MEVKEILKKVQDGNLSIEEAEKFFRRQPFEEMGYAKLDTHRKIRSGFAEVIFCSGKATYLAGCMSRMERYLAPERRSLSMN